jgi:hypothetical protein
MCTAESRAFSVLPPETSAPQRVRIEELPEVLVHDVWYRREYDHRYLETVAGEPVRVLETGRPNTDSGPDFLNARIQIGTTEWVGDVEIHRTSSEWLQHGHDSDARYNSVILHVVLVADLWTGGLYRADGTAMAEAVLAGFLRRPLRTLLVNLRRNLNHRLPCRESWPTIPDTVKQTLVCEMADARMERRIVEFNKDLMHRDDPEQWLYERIMNALGYAKNREPMLELSRRAPLSTLRRLESRIDVEALLLGTAGLVPTPDKVEGSDADLAYVETLRNRFGLLNGNEDREPMRQQQWRFFRLRPSNFPTIRIAQAAAMTSLGVLAGPDSINRLYRAIETEQNPLQSLRQSFVTETSSFWQSHVRLERPSRGGPTSLGRSRIDHIILNAVLPTIRAEAQRRRDRRTASLAREISRRLPPENDEITRRYDGLGLPSRSAETTQGLHELHGSLCSKFGCLRCRVGRFILSR